MISAAPRVYAFSIADLEAFDGAARATNSRERRFLCPLCGEGKPKDTPHRSFCANVETGAWNCKRCKATGKLTDFWRDETEPRPKLKPLARARQRRAQLSALPDEKPKATPETEGADWREQLAGAGEIDGTAAETYLRGRGIDIETAKAAGAMYAPKFYGAPAVVFPICDRDGNQTGASGRYFRSDATPKTRIAGTRRGGLFATPGALASQNIIITEAPIDALSVATAGFSAVALCGTSAPHWMHIACGLKSVFPAFDADEAGDVSAADLIARLTPYGARCERLRPESAKDWNEALQGVGSVALGTFIARRLVKLPYVREAREFHAGALYDPEAAQAEAWRAFDAGEVTAAQRDALLSYSRADESASTRAPLRMV
jgi:hypothetical protein